MSGEAELPKVVFAITALRTGGSETQLVELISRTHGKRLRAELITILPGVDSALGGRLGELGVPVTELGFQARRPLHDLAGYRRAVRALRRTRPDALYAWLEAASLVLVPPARRLGLATVVARRSIRGANAERNPALRLLIRRAERRADLVTANSEAVAEEAIRRGIERDRIRIAPNGHELVEPAPPFPEPPVSLGYLANFRPHKGQIRFLEGLALLDPSLAWRAELRGGGPLLEAVTEEVRRRGLDERVSVGPLRDSPAEFWARQHVGVLTSDSEGSPNALIEAAGAGRPLLVTDGPGLAEAVGAGGVVVEQDDPGKLADALASLISDHELRARLGAEARRGAASRFGFENSVNRHLAALEEAIRRR